MEFEFVQLSAGFDSKMDSGAMARRPNALGLQGGSIARRPAGSGSGGGRHRPAERLCARIRKSHLPEVCIGREKFERHDTLAVTTRPQRNYLAFRFLPAVLVYQQKRLANDHTGIQYRQSAVSAHTKRARLDLEFFIVLGIALDSQIHKDRNASCSAAFDAAKVKG
jgi:hypothetical protein